MKWVYSTNSVTGAEVDKKMENNGILEQKVF